MTISFAPPLVFEKLSGRPQDLLRRLAPLAAGVASLGVAALVVALVWYLQVAGRVHVLVWDEAARVQAGRNLVDCGSHAGLGCAWQWANAQTFYPFVVPLLHGVLLAYGFSAFTSAWLVSAAAFAVAGLLVVRLTLSLGGRQPTAWLAALLWWTCPLAVRLAAWGAMEHVGACVFLLLASALVGLERRPSWPLAVATGLIATLAWLVKWDYGFAAWGALVLTLAASVLQRRGDWLRGAAMASTTSILTLTAWLSFNLNAKLDGGLLFTKQGISYHDPQHDPLFYLKGLFGSEVGVGPLLALVFLAGAFWAVYAWRRRALATGPLFVLGSALVMYSASEVKNLRYLAPLLPFLALFAALLLQDAFALLQRLLPRRASFNVALALVAVVAALQLSTLIAGPSGLRTRSTFLAPDPTAEQLLAYAGSQLSNEKGPALLVGWTNVLNPFAFQLAWADARGRAAPAVWAAGPVSDAAAQLVNAGIGTIVAIEATPDSPVYDAGAAATQAANPDYAAAAHVLEAKGVLVRVGSLRLDANTAVTIWHRAPTPKATAAAAP